jgi:hypothetical protein
LRRNPLDDSSSGARIDRAMEAFFATSAKWNQHQQHGLMPM